MRELDALVIAGDEPRGDQQLDQSLVLMVRRHPALGEVATDGLTLVGGGHEAKQQVPERGLLLGPDLLVDLLGGLRDGATDATVARYLATVSVRPSTS